jgi:hypothetical protein
MMSNGSPQHILNEYVSLLQVSRRGRAVHVFLAPCCTRQQSCRRSAAGMACPGLCFVACRLCQSVSEVRM